MQEGYYPHFFNTANDLDFVGSHPEPKFYGADFMSGDERTQFSSWYEGVKDKIFNNREEVLAYCKDDVNVLRPPVTLHETSYHYKAYLEKLLNYGSDASSTHLVSSFWYLDSSGELKDNSGFVKRLHYLSSDNTIELYGRLHADLFNSDKIAACTHSIEPEDYPLRHSSTCSFLFATPATIKRQCAYSVLSLDCVLIAAGWRSSSRTNHIYKYCTYTHILSVDSVSLSD